MFDFTHVETDVFSLEGLAAWLEQQPGETEYDYDCIGGCLLHIYFTARGLKPKYIGSQTWCDEDGGDYDLPAEFNNVAVYHPHTYAAALERTRAAIAERAR